MAIQYALEIKNLEVIPTFAEKSNVVYKVITSYTGTDESGNSASTQFIIQLNNPGDDFVELVDLTEEVVLGWISSALSIAEDRLKEEVDKKFELQKEINTYSISPPWK